MCEYSPIYDILIAVGCKMTFEEFLKTYDVANFAWEIFKGISPTIIALVTIWINANISKKRSQKEYMAEQVKELQMMIANLTPYILDTGAYLLESIQRADRKSESDEMFNKFYKSNSQMLSEARKFLAYANIRAVALERDNLEFSKEFSCISDYSNELRDILAWYNKMAQQTPMEKFDSLCDEVQKKLIDATEKIESILFNYCKRIFEKK